MKQISISKTDAPRLQPYAKLRGALKELGLRQDDLAIQLKCSRNHITQAMTARTAWTLPECYKILKIINQPTSTLHDYFPEGGYSNAKEKTNKAAIRSYSPRIVRIAAHDKVAR